ncbi:MAG: hypothetical protein ACP5NF_06370 [Thermoanaerobaculum sp.]
MRPKSNVLILFSVVLFGIATWAWCQQQEAPLSNADVIKLCAAGLGDDLVIAKINQAKSVDFKLDTDSLIALQKAGVSKAVIAAMLKRTTPSEAGTASTASGPVAAGGSGLPAAAATEQEGVWLRTQNGLIKLRSVRGDVSSTYAVVTVLLFADFPGLNAEVRIQDPRPTAVVKTSKDPRGRVFFVRAESNKDDGTRSVKLGKSGMVTMKSVSTPDKDWTIPCDVKETEPGVWEMTPKADLKKGEYGLLFAISTGELQGGWEMYDFGVD